MAIEIRQQGEAGLYAQAGHAIGAAQKAEREQQIAVQRENMLIENAERRRAEQVSRDWDLQKMVLNSQQDFAHQQRLHQADLEAEARSKEWEVQKMELRSQMDFQKEEQARQKEYDEFLSTEKYIRDKVASSELPKEKADDLYFMNAYQHSNLNKPEIVARLGGTAEYIQRVKTGRSGEESTVETALRNLGGATGDGTPPPTKVWVYTNKGRLASIPGDQLEEAVSEGAKLAPGQQLPKSPKFQEAQTQWAIEQQLLGRDEKTIVFRELDKMSKLARGGAAGPGEGGPFAPWAARSKLVDMRKKYPAYYEEWIRQSGGQL